LPQFTNTGENVPNYHKISQVSIKYIKWPKNSPNVHKIYQHIPLQGPPKFTQTRIFGLKKCHLAVPSSEAVRLKKTFFEESMKPTNSPKAPLDFLSMKYLFFRVAAQGCQIFVGK
jgi:hypothetical protein